PCQEILGSLLRFSGINGSLGSFGYEIFFLKIHYGSLSLRLFPDGFRFFLSGLFCRFFLLFFRRLSVFLYFSALRLFLFFFLFFLFSGTRNSAALFLFLFLLGSRGFLFSEDLVNNILIRFLLSGLDQSLLCSDPQKSLCLFFNNLIFYVISAGSKLN